MISPVACASQSTHVQRYDDGGHLKIKLVAEHDHRRCPICELCMQHCVGHAQVLDGLRPQLEPVTYAAIRRQAAEDAVTAAMRTVAEYDGPTVRKVA